MKNKKLILALTAALLVAAVGLTACQNEVDGGSSTSSEESSQIESSEETSQEESSAPSSSAPSSSAPSSTPSSSQNTSSSIPLTADPVFTIDFTESEAGINERGKAIFNGSISVQETGGQLKLPIRLEGFARNVSIIGDSCTASIGSTELTFKKISDNVIEFGSASDTIPPGSSLIFVFGFNFDKLQSASDVTASITVYGKTLGPYKHGSGGLNYSYP